MLKLWSRRTQKGNMIKIASGTVAGDTVEKETRLSLELTQPINLQAVQSNVGS